MAKRSVRQGLSPTTAQNFPTDLMCQIAMPVGPRGLLRIDPESSPEDRQTLASCLLETVESCANDLACTEDEDMQAAKNLCWALAHLTSIANGLITSLDLRKMS